MKPIVIIPSRMASTRLPGKPLAEIGGRPMIVRVVEQALAADIGPVAVATPDPEIVQVVKTLGVSCVLTAPELPSGSDRVHAAINELDPEGRHDVIVNFQGDLPLFVPGDLRRVLRPLENPQFDIGTLAAPITSDQERDATSVVKIACDFMPGQDVARSLYFSRAIIPWGEGPLWHHVGVYAWRRQALASFVNAPQSLLERRESLEQLRALDLGLAIGCTRIDVAPHGVDTPHDLARVRAIVSQREGNAQCP